MNAHAPTVRAGSKSPPRSWQQTTSPPPANTLETATDPGHPLELDTVAAQWQLALDAAQHALAAGSGLLHGADVSNRQRELVQERQQTAVLLARLAHIEEVTPEPWLSPVPITPKMLGLPATARACLFDLDGVLTDSGQLHSRAWAEAFDPLLLRVSEKLGWHFIPFDRGADYRAFIDGRPRLEGVHTFLASRGIGLPEGKPDDPPDADTANGVANHKRDALARRMHQRGVAALDGARRYLEAAGHAGLKRAVVSASASTSPMLELAGLSTLVEEQVDADVIRHEGLRSRPAPDLLLAACNRLGIPPEEAVTLTHTPAGVAAGRTARLAVVGVGDGAQGDLLRGFDAETVVGSLSALLDPRLVTIGR